MTKDGTVACRRSRRESARLPRFGWLTAARWSWLAAASLAWGCTCAGGETTTTDTTPAPEDAETKRKRDTEAGPAASASSDDPWARPTQHRLAVGTTHACVIQVDGGIDCFGDESDGKTVAPAERFVAIAAVHIGTHAVTDDGVIVTWGAASKPSLGTSWDAIACFGAGDTCCARERSGLLRCWGTFAPTFESDPMATAFTSFAGEVCWIEADGSLACREGLRAQTHRASGRFRDVSRGTSGLCAVQADGKVVCWSSAKFLDQAPSFELEGNFVAVSSGGDGSCALRDDGRLHCWGASWAEAAIDGRYREVACAGIYCCGLSQEDEVGCFGDAAAPVVRARPLR